MRKSVGIGITALALSGCLQPLDERAIEIAVKDCDTLSHQGAVVRNLDLPVEGKYLTVSDMAYVNKVLQERTDCYLAAVYEIAKENRGYVIMKKNSTLVLGYPQLKKIYP